MWNLHLLQTLVCIILILLAKSSQQETVSSGSKAANASEIQILQGTRETTEKDKPSSKTARHLSPKQLLKETLLAGLSKSPMFNKMKEGQLVIVKQVQGAPQQQITGAESNKFARYAPRSLDMGLGSLASLFGGDSPSLLPTSGAPNSLDHLYLPEMSLSNYVQPLDRNGIAAKEDEEISASPYASDYGYQGGKGGPFRGHPKDIGFHRGHDHYNVEMQSHPRGPPHKYMHRGESSNSHVPPQPPVSTPPGKPPKGSSNAPRPEPHHDDHTGHGGFSDDDGPPPGYDRVSGDIGFHKIISLANLVDSNAFPEQLSGITGATFGDSHPTHRPRYGERGHSGPPPSHDDDYRDERDSPPRGHFGQRGHSGRPSNYNNNYGYDSNEGDGYRERPSSRPNSSHNNRKYGHDDDGDQDDYGRRGPYGHHPSHEGRPWKSGSGGRRQHPDEPFSNEYGGDQNRDLSYLNGKDGNDAPPPGSGHSYDPDSDYDSGPGYGEEDGHRDDRYDSPRRQGPKHSRRPHGGPNNQRPFDDSGYDDDSYNSQEQEQYDSPPTSIPHRTPNGFAELMAMQSG